MLARETRTDASVQVLSRHLAGLLAAEDRGVEQQQMSAEPLPDHHETRGHVTIDGTRRSPAWQFIQRAASILVREAGF